MLRTTESRTSVGPATRSSREVTEVGECKRSKRGETGLCMCLQVVFLRSDLERRVYKINEKWNCLFEESFRGSERVRCQGGVGRRYTDGENRKMFLSKRFPEVTETLTVWGSGKESKPLEDRVQKKRIVQTGTRQYRVGPNRELKDSLGRN